MDVNSNERLNTNADIRNNSVTINGANGRIIMNGIVINNAIFFDRFLICGFFKNGIRVISIKIHKINNAILVNIVSLNPKILNSIQTIYNIIAIRIFSIRRISIFN